MAAVAQNEPVHGEAGLARLVPAEHLDGDGEAHVVAHGHGPGDVERARQLARAPALVEERVGGARRLVGEAEAELVEERHAETPAQQWQRGREVVAGRWEAVHQEQVRSLTFLRHEQPVALGQGDEAPAAVPVLVHGAVHVAARAAGARAAADLSKAMPIVLLAGLVATEPAPVGQAYRWLVFAGLLCSLGGDVWLLFPRGFVAGLASFLLAHLLYIAAFAPGTPWNASAWVLLAPSVLVCLVLLRHLWPLLGRVRPPVAVYVSVIAVMGWRAAVRVTAAPAASGGLALAGALLFMLSDGLLATDRFVRRFAAADAALMTTYYAAQTLIALSVRG